MLQALCLFVKKKNSYTVKVTADHFPLWKATHPLLTRLDMELTERCNNNCIHCCINLPADDLTAKERELSTKEIEAILREAASLGCLTVRFTGGEPLLRPDVLRDGIKLFSDNTITTNGTLKPIDLPNCTYVISVDGPPKLNNAIRGNGTFKKVINTLSNIPEKFSSTVMCQCVVTRQNEDS